MREVFREEVVSESQAFNPLDSGKAKKQEQQEKKETKENPSQKEMLLKTLI